MDFNNRFLRQQDVVDVKMLAKLPVTIIGAGSIGSTTALWLGKMGVAELTVFDDDIVEEHNWSNQVYRYADIQQPKVLALQRIMQRFGIQRPEVVVDKYTDQSLAGIVISGVDSMSSRKTIWKSVKQQSQVRLYIDARMGLETLMVYTVNPQLREDRIRYAKTLHSDQDSLQEPCTARTICYTPLMAASFICNLIKKYANQEMLPSMVTMDMATYSLLV